MGRKGTDLTGQKFGRLTVIEPTAERKYNAVMWRCLCDCGNECLVASRLLVSGGTKSCGCLVAEKARLNAERLKVNGRKPRAPKARLDLTGKRFGRLTVISELSERRNREVMWHCVCDCGNECDVRGHSLRSGETQSCGCYRLEQTKKANTGRCVIKKDLTGQTFGHLTAIRFLYHDYWVWQCDCGKVCKIRSCSVINGVTKSCGHALPARQRERVTEENVFQHYDGTNITQLKSIMNGKVRSDNTTGYTGIRERHTSNGVRYQARIVLRGKSETIGTFDTLEEAVEARKKAEHIVFGEVIEDWENSNEAHNSRGNRPVGEQAERALSEEIPSAGQEDLCSTDADS